MVNAHIAVYRIIDEAMNIELQPHEIEARENTGCVARAGGSRSKTYYICKYCKRIDKNERKDHVQDHLESFHNYYTSLKKWQSNLQIEAHIKRKNSLVLFEIIKRERALFNCLRKHQFLFESSKAYLEGSSPVPNPIPRDAQGDDIQHLSTRRGELVDKLMEERKMLAGVDWDSEIRSAMESAWSEARKKGLGFIDWGRV